MKADRLQIRTEPKEIEGWREAADIEGLTLSEWIRRVLNQASAVVRVRILEMQRRAKRGIRE